MSSNSEKQRKFFDLVKAIKKGETPINEVSQHIRKVVGQISDKDASDLASGVAEGVTKKRMLNILKELHSIKPLNETENNPMAKQFTVKDQFENYVRRYVGQPFQPKEVEALSNFEGAKPTKIERAEIRFETTDEFNNNTTTVIKKMKDSGQFSFTAFTKHTKTETKEDEPEQSEPTGMDSPSEPPMKESDEMPSDEKDDIFVSKSTLFNDDIKGSALLIEFLKKLDL